MLHGTGRLWLGNVVVPVFVEIYTYIYSASAIHTEIPQCNAQTIMSNTHPKKKKKKKAFKHLPLGVEKNFLFFRSSHRS